MPRETRKQRPDSSDYAVYYETYVRKVPDGDIIDLLRDQLETTGTLLENIPEARHGFRYAEDKWSVREVIGHILDTERMFAYRALSFARGDQSSLPGMDQDDFMADARFEDRTMESIAEEHLSLRRSNIALFDSFDDDILDRRGVASDCPFTVRALIYIIAGHERHHIDVLREKYLELS